MSLSFSKEEVLQAIQALIHANDLDKGKRIIEIHASLLLTDYADQLFEILIRQYAGDINVASILEQRRDLLKRCRKQGIERAFAILKLPQNVEEDLNYILPILSHPARSTSDIPRRLKLCQKALELVNRNQQPEIWAALQNLMGDNLTRNPQGGRDDNLEQAISHFQQALKIFTLEDFPEDWAETQNNLANAYRARICGVRSNNLEQATIHYREALRIYTQEAFPEYWAMTQNNLANVYREEIRGDRAKNLEQALDCLQKSLKVYTREAFPEYWAMTQHNLAKTYIDRIRGVRAKNLELAIGHFQKALTIYTREAFSEYWAVSQQNLADAYLDRIYGDRAENLEQAIVHFQQALKIFTQETFPKNWADAQKNLANAYRDRIYGMRSENWELAIVHYSQAFNIYTPEAFPEDWAETQHNLANTYIEHIHGDRAENLEQAIVHFQQALKVIKREAFPAQFASIQHNLATAYLYRIRGEHAGNLEQAIVHFQQALKVRTREAFPKDWAATKNNLANVYLHRIRGDRTENLEQAISYLQQALKVHTQDAFPEDWAMAQHNIANVYSLRIHGEHADNVEQAIFHFQQALKIYTSEAFPEQWASTKVNLATAYRKRIFGERADNLEQAIFHLQRALKIYTPEAFPEQWAATQNNLAGAYLYRILGDRAENLEQAIGHFQRALKFRTRAAFPKDWAMTQYNLATVYHNRIHGKRGENLEQAISHFQQALKIFTLEDFPEDWAMTQHNLANTYSDRTQGDRSENLEQAHDCFQKSLKIFTREAFPAKYRQVQRNLGNFHFEQNNWPHALKAYERAIAAGNDLLASAYSEAGRQAEVGETAQVFSHASYCLLQNHQYDEAFVMLERGKTRVLTEELALADLDVGSLPIKYRSALKAARQSVKALETEMRLRSDITDTSVSEIRSIAAQLREKRAELFTLIDTIRQDYPDFLPVGLSLYSILALIPTEGALAAPVFTTKGSAVFVIPHGTTEVNPGHVIHLDDFKQDDLHNLIRGSEEELGWLSEYQNYHNTRYLKNWQEAIRSFIERLWQILIDPIYQKLSALGVKRLLFLPSSGLQLMPIHAAWFKDKNSQQRNLLDDYEITYAPSAYALDIASRRVKLRYTIMSTDHTALVAGVNSYDNLSQLINAVPEAESISQLLGTKPLLDAAATVSAVKSGAVSAAYLHLSCHGSFNWDKPMDSSLYFAQDEPLKLSDIISELDLSSALLVTLSACETGISEVRRSPDEYLGLPAGFLQAGAPAIISSLWVVDDRSTALLMERFYRNHIEQRMNGPAALREAQLWLRDATREELGNYYKNYMRMTAQEAFDAFMDVSGAPDECPYADPFYWAAFTYNGASI